MASVKMPPYVCKRARKDHCVYYFVVPARLRPEGWPASIRLGTDTHDGLQAIHDYALFKYNELQELKKRADTSAIQRIRPGTILDIIDQYHKSDDYRLLAKETQHSYDRYLKVIETWANKGGNPHIKTLTAPVIYAFLNKYADRPRQQKYFKAVLSLLCTVAVRQGHIEYNVTREVRLSTKRKKQQQRLVVWSEADIDHFVRTADSLGYFNVGTAVMIAFYTGQRQADVFRYMEPRDYKDGYFRTEASKTGAIINLQADPKLEGRLKQRPSGQLMLTVNDRTGRPWTKDAFEKQFDKVRKSAGMDKHIFRQLRNSAAMHAEQADLTDAEFEAIFGWPREQVQTMLRNYYSDRNQASAESGVAKLHAYREKQRSRTDF